MNIAEILKYCPKGTKLYSTIWEEVKLVQIDEQDMIDIKPKDRAMIDLYPDGRMYPEGECVIFPSKYQRDWSKFRLPAKRGDIMMIPNTDHAFITTGRFTDNGSIRFVCGIDADNELFINPSNAGCTSEFYIPASEEAKKELFDKMAEAGYKWNADTLELEEIKPCFKEGDVIVDSDGYLFLSTGVIKDDKIQVCCLFADGAFIDCGVSMHPSPISSLKLASVDDRNNAYSLLVKKGYKYDKKQHNIVKQEFKPFDKVLVRNNTDEDWTLSLFSHYSEKDKGYPFVCINGFYYNRYCIPYEGNEYLLGTTDSPE